MANCSIAVSLTLLTVLNTLFLIAFIVDKVFGDMLLCCRVSGYQCLEWEFLDCLTLGD